MRWCRLLRRYKTKLPAMELIGERPEDTVRMGYERRGSENTWYSFDTQRERRHERRQSGIHVMSQKKGCASCWLKETKA